MLLKYINDNVDWQIWKKHILRVADHFDWFIVTVCKLIISSWLKGVHEINILYYILYIFIQLTNYKFKSIIENVMHSILKLINLEYTVAFDN